MATISKTGIQDGLTSKAEHITRIIDALDGTATTEVVATGSFTGSFDGIHTGTITSASYAVTASYAENAGGSANKLHLQFQSDSPGDNFSSSRTYSMGNGGITLRLAASPPGPSNIQNYFPAPVTGTIVSSSIAFMENTVTGTSGTDGNVQVSLFNLDTNVSESMFNAITLFAQTTSSMVSTNLAVNAGDRICMILVVSTLAGTVPADGRVNGTALLVES